MSIVWYPQSGQVSWRYYEKFYNLGLFLIQFWSKFVCRCVYKFSIFFYIKIFNKAHIENEIPYIDRDRFCRNQMMWKISTFFFD